MINIYYEKYMIFLVNSSADNYLGLFNFLAIVHKATMYMTEQVSVH